MDWWNGSRAERLLIAGGGVAFASVLAACVARFLVTFGATDLPFRFEALAVNTALVAAFAAHHSMFARPWVKQRLSMFIPDRLLRTCYVYVASALLLLVCWQWQPVGALLYRLESPLALLFHGLQVTGLALIVWAARVIDPLELAGLRQSPANDAPSRNGPYGYIRHPIYLGWILLVCATPVMTGDRFAFAALTTAYIAAAIPWEERDLRHVFGERYDGYRQSVRWRLLPYLY